MTAVEHSSVQRIRQEEHGTLQDLTVELLRLAETKADYIVDTRRCTFTTMATAEYHPDAEVPLTQGEGTTSLLTFDTQDHDGVSGGPVNEYAHRQIRERLGIPAKYYDRLRQQAPQLLDTNVQHWLLMTPETRMVRMMDGRVRAGDRGDERRRRGQPGGDEPRSRARGAAAESAEDRTRVRPGQDAVRRSDGREERG